MLADRSNTCKDTEKASRNLTGGQCLNPSGYIDISDSGYSECVPPRWDEMNANGIPYSARSEEELRNRR